MIYKFKIGDTVTLKVNSRWNDGEIHNPIGICGIITSIEDEVLGINVIWKNGETAYYDHKDLKCPRIKDTKIARKMNQNRIDKIEEGWIYLK